MKAASNRQRVNDTDVTLALSPRKVLALASAAKRNAGAPAAALGAVDKPGLPLPPSKAATPAGPAPLAPTPVKAAPAAAAAAVVAPSAVRPPATPASLAKLGVSAPGAADGTAAVVALASLSSPLRNSIKKLRATPAAAGPRQVGSRTSTAVPVVVLRMRHGGCTASARG
jgi:hypothetical protein